VDVDIQNYAFVPQTLYVLPGTTVRWTNRDSAAHTTTSDTGLWNSGDLGQGQTFSYTFNTVGTYPYHCGRHPGMQGTIVVIMPGTGTPEVTQTATSQPTQTAQATGTAQVTGTAQATGTAQPTRTPSIVNIRIESYAYNSNNVSISAGTTVRWTNYDNDLHSVTENNGLFDSGRFSQGQSWQYTFNTPGTYTYFCTVHGQFMTGTVNVTAAQPTETPGATGTVQATGTAQATTTPGACNITFTDVQPGSTFYTFVQCLACRNILGGYADGSFRPNADVTRGQLAKIVSNSAGYDDTPTGQTFEDVPADSTFYLWIERIAGRGVISGYACGAPGEPCNTSNRPYFRPGANATRGQISKIVAIAKNYNNTPTGQTFEDVPATNTFYLWVEQLASRGAMSGYACGGPGEPCGPDNKPYFRAFNNATRGQIAKIVSNSFFPDCNQ
jgi:plastocyanin